MKFTILMVLAAFAVFATAESTNHLNLQSIINKYPTLESLINDINQMYNNIQAVINQILTTGSVIGKREIDQKGLFNFLSDAFHVIYDPIDNIAITLSSMLVHVFAGIAAEGLPAPGRRSITFANDVEAQRIFSSIYESLYPWLNSVTQSVSLSIAQTLLAISNDGLAALLPGKRDATDKRLLQGIYETLHPFVNPYVQSLSLAIAQTLLEVSNNGLATLLPGKRDVDQKGLFNFLSDAFHVIYDPIDNIAITLSGMLVHVFAGIAAEGLPAPGRRSITFSNDVEAQRIFSSIYESLYPWLNSVTQSVSLSIAQTLLAISNDGLAALLPGKRDIDQKGLFNFLSDAFHVIYDPIDNIAITLSGMLVHVFAGIAAEGLPAPGRR